jgi:hypothetical protein
VRVRCRPLLRLAGAISNELVKVPFARRAREAAFTFMDAEPVLELVEPERLGLQVILGWIVAGFEGGRERGCAVCVGGGGGGPRVQAMLRVLPCLWTQMVDREGRCQSP